MATEDVVRGELFSDDRLAEFARSIASNDTHAPGTPFRFQVKNELTIAWSAIQSACVVIESAVREERSITQAARWLIENVHVVEEQLADLPEVLSRKLVAGLPRGVSASNTVPRIYTAAVGYVRHSDCLFDSTRFRNFVNSYQSHELLQMNELWALPAILRLVLLTNLARIATRTASALAARQLADITADRALSDSEATGTGDFALRLPERTLHGPFLVQLAERLRFGGHPAVRALAMLNKLLASEGRTLDELVRDEYSRQSTNNVTARNIITSFREIGANDWREFFEATSAVETLLSAAPSYEAADFLTRDRYRKAIEELAKSAQRSESDVARALGATTQAAMPPALEADVGYHLIAAGRSAFEQHLGVRITLSQKLRRAVMPNAASEFIFMFSALTAMLLAFALWQGRDAGAMEFTLSWWLLAVIAIVPCSELAVALLNRVLMWSFPPRRLPRLALRDGIPAQSRTLVVVPVMIASVQDIQHHLRQLEVHAIANSDEEIRFALLSDWPDSDDESRPTDGSQIEYLRAGIATLNAKYPTRHSGDARFYVLHRRRQWNSGERRWMGWERKRGKLTELNTLIHGGATSFIADASGQVETPRNIRYVVTLDADTRLPYGAVSRLVGVASHPLNQPRFDPIGRRVIGGYGVIQPRVVPLLPRRGERSLYRSVVTGSSGMDPYAGTISDVYQDVFGEGIFTGKGLYDVAAFEQVMSGRVPDNVLLSHDLLEGLYARCALASDIECYEDFPSHSEVGAARLHRWTRGDWQLLPWLLTSRGSDIPLLGQWKMWDNLRRSLVPPAAIATLFLACADPQSNALFWLALVLAPALLPNALASGARLANALADRSIDIAIRSELATWAADLRNAVVSLALLAQNAWLMVDAITRAVVRQFITRRRRLEWMTAAQAQSVARYGLRNFSWSMKGASIIVLITSAGLMVAYPPGLGRAAPLLLLWWLAPLFARRLSLPPDARPRAAHAGTAQALRQIARRTFRYFTTFVTAEENFLPPDNFQETPHEIVAHRTSPTNIGVYLLVCASAQELGWLGLRDTCRRLTATLTTLGVLERHRGHFFNWYDTRSRLPLEPRYVSTVDSGNLCGHLIALAQWCTYLRQHPMGAAARAAGLADSLAVVLEALAKLPTSPQGTAVGANEVSAELQRAAALLNECRASSDDGRKALAAFAACATRIDDLCAALAHERGAAAGELAAWAQLLAADALSHVADFGEAANLETTQSLLDIEARCEAFIVQMDFNFLFDAKRRLFSIGWRAADGMLDSSFYDLLASEARLASFVAIAKGDVPPRHWTHLSRRLTGQPAAPLLVSWSGSMFEYLMPPLIMREPNDGLLDISSHRAVAAQIQYGRRRAVPWGISEAAFNVRDAELTYQYSAFGVPGLGLKRGLERNVVIAPYATALAAIYEPDKVVANYAALERLGALGRYGFYESIDFTRERLPESAQYEVVRAFMAHHQGMSIVALCNTVGQLSTAAADDALGMRRHFHADARVQAADLLLQERAPGPSARPRTLSDARVPAHVVAESAELERQVIEVATESPVVQLLSNRHYAVMLTAAGGGYSVHEGQAVTRWREDGTRDAYGSWIYLRDVEQGNVWSATYQPTSVRADAYSARFSEERASIERRDGRLRTVLEVIIASDDDAELRRLTVHNDDDVERVIEVTSYAEIVLAPLAADIAHRAFSNLFVQTEWIAEQRGTLLARRRPRSAEEPTCWAGHVVAATSGALETLQYETDRARFLGRNGDAAAPLALAEGRPLSNTVGAVLDPVFSLRLRLNVAPQSSCEVVFTTFVASTRDSALRIADKYRQSNLFERVAMHAWTYSRAGLHHLRVDLAEARLFQILAGHVVFAGARQRADREMLAANTASYGDLWRFGISGDRPIVLVRCTSLEDLAAAQQILRAQEYWRTKQLIVDVVLLNEQAQSYEQELQLALEEAVRTSRAWSAQIPTPMQPAAFAIAARALTERDQKLLLSAARAILVPSHGSLAEQIVRAAPAALPTLATVVVEAPAAPATAQTFDDESSANLEYYNGFGGFADDGHEYVFPLREGRRTPQPWSNVIANPRFGTVVTESGAMCTWSRNSRENQLTPWSNDAVSDPSGEVVYVRDEASGLLWTPTAAPIHHTAARYRSAHGQGYSRFECEIAGIASELTVWVDNEAPVKWLELKLRNQSAQTRRLTVTGYVEWLLGSDRARNAPFVVTERDAGSGILLARNPWNRDFAQGVAWFDMQAQNQQWTASRREFLGRHGSLARPAALVGGTALSGRTGAGFDPCAANRTRITLERGASTSVLFTLGEDLGRDAALSAALAARATGPAASIARVHKFWNQHLSTVQIRTPDRALDLLVNRWLLYQVTSCRLWGRTAFYQSGGAYGFRDQLQDVLALLITAPQLARAHILLAAERQFVAGDVQHWWHPPSGRGVRTKMVDDRVWLAYVTAHYLRVTGDAAILDEVRAFIEGDTVAEGHEDAHYEPRVATDSASLYEHCARALDISLAAGSHGLPLMGGGDWNDGMNRVGIAGRGESVWMAWFLIDTLLKFAPTAEARGDTARASRWRASAAAFRVACEEAGWDGAWYRRAFFDDGTPLGSATNVECRIDSIAQSWAVLSGAAPPERANRAMDAVSEYLVRDADDLILLFTPPFDRSTLDPGYIKGYLPGLRENGGQYTHAAIWTLMAYAELGRVDDVAELLQALNPVHRSATRRGSAAYMVEPYVMAADIYSESPHAKRGGWTWYTGAAGWMYRAVLESVLGVRILKDTIEFAPCLPPSWPSCEITYRNDNADYRIVIANGGTGRFIVAVEVDGIAHDGDRVPLLHDGAAHEVRVMLR